MGPLEGFSGVEGIVAWISNTTLCPAYAKAISPNALKKLKIVPAVVFAMYPYSTLGCTPFFTEAVQAIVE